MLKDPIVETVRWIDDESPTNLAKSPARVGHGNFRATPEIIKKSNKLFNITNGNFSIKNDQKTSMNKTLGGFEYRKVSFSVGDTYRQGADKNSKDTEAKASNIRSIVDFLAGNDTDTPKKLDTGNFRKDRIYSVDPNSLNNNISKAVNADNIDRTLIYKKQKGGLAEKIKLQSGKLSTEGLQNPSDPKLQHKSALDNRPESKIGAATLTADKLVKMNENRINLKLTEIAKTHETNFSGKDAMMKGPGPLSFTEIGVVGVEFVTPRAHLSYDGSNSNQHSNDASMFTTETATTNPGNAPKNSTKGQKAEPMAIGPRQVLTSNHELHTGPSTDLHKLTWTRLSKDQSSRISLSEHPNAADSKFIKKINSTVHHYTIEKNSHNFNSKVTPTNSTRDIPIGSDFSGTTNGKTPNMTKKTILSSISGTGPGEKYTTYVNSSGIRTSVGNSERPEQLKEDLMQPVQYINDTCPLHCRDIWCHFSLSQ